MRRAWIALLVLVLLGLAGLAFGYVTATLDSVVRRASVSLPGWPRGARPLRVLLGQIVLPFYGPLGTASDYGRRFLCGVVKENGRTLVVGAGLGTSVLPLRVGARPDLWLVEVGP